MGMREEVKKLQQEALLQLALEVRGHEDPVLLGGVEQDLNEVAHKPTDLLPVVRNGPERAPHLLERGVHKELAEGDLRQRPLPLRGLREERAAEARLEFEAHALEPVVPLEEVDRGVV